MNWGCLSFIILFPVGLIIWAKGEMRRRKAMPPAELEKLEAEEKHGEFESAIECIYCHSKNCIRIRHTYFFQLPAHVAEKNIEARIMDAHCMKCGSHWDMFPPNENQSQ